MAEQPRSETEQSPDSIAEQATDQVVSVAETQDALDSNASSAPVKKSREWVKCKVAAGLTVGGLAGGIFIAGKTILSLVEFAKTAIEKKGNISFKEGYKIGESISNFNNKDKK